MLGPAYFNQKVIWMLKNHTRLENYQTGNAFHTFVN